jgi:hypothetical protein
MTLDVRRNGRRSSQVPTAVPAREAKGTRLLTKAEYERTVLEWADWNHRNWQPFREAWVARGFVHPPVGSPYDNPDSRSPSARALLWPIADARPKDLARWVREAPAKTPHQIVRYVLDRWDTVRSQYEETEEWDEEKRASRKAAPELLREIIKRAG